MTEALPVQLSTPKAFALMLETACEQFEVLQLICANQIRFVDDQQDDVRKSIKFLRAPFCIRAALAKSFVANVIRARRICEHGHGALNIDRTERKLFMSRTGSLLRVRDVNEHGFDANDTDSRPTLHFNGGGFLDETSLYIGGPEEILMGPLNLYYVYRAAARMRDLAGFRALNRSG